MDYMIINGELYHWGIKGMKWGRRRYQNKDGSLTPEGKKRYGDDDGNSKSSKGESDEVKRARLLKSTDAKELYENRNLLTTNELNERINRIDTEARLSSKIVQEHQQTGVDRVKSMAEKINNATNLYKSVDNAYSTVANSAVGKLVAKKLGIDVPKTKEFDLDDFWKNRNKKTAAELMEVNKRLTAEDAIKEKMNKRAEEAAAEKARKDAQKQVDDYNKAGAPNDRVTPNDYSKKGDDIVDNKVATGKATVNRLLLETKKDKEIIIDDGNWREIDLLDDGQAYVDDLVRRFNKQMKHSDINENTQEVTHMTESQLFVESYLAHHDLAPDELAHYGVLGMKWGVRRGNYSRAYGRASKKRNKLNTKATKINLKAAKLQKKALEKETKAKNEKQYQKAREIQFKANKLNLKSAKLTKKGDKWEKKMEAAFKDVKISEIKPEHLEVGKKYTYMLAKG